ncbi:MAG: hypothetical protein FWD57_03330 [Polyangiaceae bacterium]|nr:hypothetical protein [Polyangiaceae bacterium]
MDNPNRRGFLHQTAASTAILMGWVALSGSTAGCNRSKQTQTAGDGGDVEKPKADEPPELPLSRGNPPLDDDAWIEKIRANMAKIVRTRVLSV